MSKLWPLYLILGAAWVFLLTRIEPAHSHEWFSGKYNPGTNERCCDLQDCRVIGDEDWWTEGGKIFVKWSDGRTYSMPASQAQPTEDPQGRPAACVLSGRLRCAFIPLSY